MPNPMAETLPKMTKLHAQFMAYAAGLSTEAANEPIGDGQWSRRAIVGHLVDAERAHRRFIEAVAAGNPPAKPENFDLDAWNASRVAKRAAQTLAELLAAFDAERAETLRVLEQLPPDAWDKQGYHPALGEMTVEQVARIIGLHERMHLKEMTGVG